MTELKDSLPEVHQSSRGSSPLVTGSISDMITPSKFASQSDCMKIDTDSSCQDSGYEKTSDTVSDCEDQIQVTTYEISSSAPPMDSPLDECDISGAVTAEVDGEDDGDDIEGDNMSMVVNQGDGGSRRASDLSTLSGLVLEDYMGGSTSQPESSDGFESPDKERRDFADEGTLKKHRDDGPDGETYDNVGDSCDAGVDSAVEDRNDADGEQLDYQYVNPVISKRNSAEIRNNIPDVNEVKDYIEDDDDLEPLKSNKHGAIPKMKKQSPGLARRVASDNSPPRDSSSSERDTTDEPLKKGKNVDLELHGKNRTKERSVSKSPVLPRSNDNHHNTVEPTDGEVNQSNGEHSTEYNIHAPQHNASNRYVGARLAFTSESIDSPSHNPESEQCNGGWASPEKAGAFQQITLEEFEKSLTEIPLDDTLDENKVNTLSEQASDVEENDGESVISETAVGNGMPNVMDGLSDSREGSDIEEFLASPEGREIQRKLDEETEQQRHLEEMKRQEVRSAMADIKSAIQKGKSAQLKSSVGAQDAPPGEAVWVMRDSYVERLQQQDEMKRVRQEIERSQEEECRRREMDQVYQIEMEDESQLTQQSKRHGGNIYKTPKGYDSDSDSYEEEHDKPMAGSWFRRKYAPIQTEGDDQQYVRQKMRSNGNRPRSHYIPNNDHSKIPAMNEKSQSSKYSSKSAENLSSGAHSYDTSVRSGYCTSPVQRDDYQPQSDPIHSSRLATANDQNRNSYHDSSSDYDSQKEEDLTPTAYVQQRKEGDYDTDEETDQLLDKQYKQEEKLDIPELQESPVNRASQNRRTKAKEVAIYDPDEPSVLIEGVLFRARYLGSTQLVSEGQPSKALRMMQAQEAVGRIKKLGTIHFGKKFQHSFKVNDDQYVFEAPEGESQPSTEVDLFVSTEKIMVLNTDLQEIMMDHALRTISYIADIEDIVVIMARRRTTTTTTESGSQKRQTKIICHVFETEEAQLVAQSIGQAFQVAYMEFLKANGIEDPGLLKDVNYEDVLNQQEIFGEELNLFANKEAEKEVIVPKIKGEALGIVIVESGWGSMVPTVVLANMSPTGAAARCGQLNIGDQIMAVNGVSLVGLPLSSCQTQIKSVKGQSVVKLTVVSCAPVVEVLIKRPDTKYQLGFSVQNGVICSLLRGGIAERGGVRVGHRIIEINSSSVVAVPHEKIVSMLANSVGEIHMKTMPTAIYRLLTGQEAPHYI